MRRLSSSLATVAVALGLAAGLAPAAEAQGLPGSVAVPIVVPRPLDLPIAQLPPLPFPLQWQPEAPVKPLVVV